MTVEEVIWIGSGIGFMLIRTGYYLRSRNYRDILKMIERQRKEQKELEDNWSQHVQ